MRCASVVCCLLMGILLAPEGVIAKQAKTDKGDKSDKKASLSSISEVEGRTLDQWASFLRDADPSMREKALTVIPQYGATAKYLVPQIILRCRHGDKGEKDLGPRVKAIMALGLMEIDDKDAHAVAAQLATALDSDPQHAAKLQAALSLTRFGNEVGDVTMSALIGGTTDSGSWQIRKASILAMRRIGVDKKMGPTPKATTYVLRAAMLDPAHHVRVEAIQALGFMGRPGNLAIYEEVIKKLKLLTNDHDKIVGIWAQTSLMALDKVTDEGMQQIAKHVNEKEQLNVRGNAIVALGTLEDRAKSSVPLILAMLKDRDNGIVVTAATALVSIGDKDPKVLAALNEVIDKKETEPRVRDTVRQALEDLKKKNDKPVVKDPSKDKDPFKP